MSRARPSAFKCSAVVSDVDGTLVTDDKRLTARAQAAVAELRASGIAFSMISARPPRGLCMLLDPLGITTPVSGFNGGVITTSELSVITEHLLSPEIARRTTEMLDARRVQVWVFSGQDCWCATPAALMSGSSNARWGSDRQWSRISDTFSTPPPRSSVSARISSFLHDMSEICDPR
jgi:hydroxymethylpyrimidine pyrophosphatase-like HAD family hydrolase